MAATTVDWRAAGLVFQTVQSWVLSKADLMAVLSADYWDVQSEQYLAAPMAGSKAATMVARWVDWTAVRKGPQKADATVALWAVESAD